MTPTRCSMYECSGLLLAYLLSFWQGSEIESLRAPRPRLSLSNFPSVITAGTLLVAEGRRRGGEKALEEG